jgi:hypothetical protein
MCVLFPSTRAHIWKGHNNYIIILLLLFWKLLAFEFLFDISDTSLRSVSVAHVQIVPLLDVHQLLMLFAGTLTYSEPRKFCLIVFYNKL